MPRHLEEVMRQYFDAEQENWHPPEAHRDLLQEVRRTPCIGITPLAERLGMSPTVCRLLIEELISLGYLTDSSCDKENSRGWLDLTEEGRSLLATSRTRIFFGKY